MAGDKKFLHFERKKERIENKLFIFGTGSASENRPFYYLFAGASLRGSVDNGVMSSICLKQNLNYYFFRINFLKTQD